MLFLRWVFLGSSLLLLSGPNVEPALQSAGVPMDGAIPFSVGGCVTNTHTAGKSMLWPCSPDQWPPSSAGISRLRGGRAPWTKGRPGKDPPLLDPVHVFDSILGGWYSRNYREDTDFFAERTEDDFQELDPEEEASKKRRRRAAGDDDMEVDDGAQEEQEEDASEPGPLELASKACLEGKFEEAQRGFEQCLAEDPNDAAAMNNFAAMLFEHKLDVDRAEALLKQALDLNPNCTAYMGNLALLILDHRPSRINEAERLFQRMLDIDPEDLSALNNYALFLQNVRSNYTGAEKLLLRAESVNRNFITTLANYIHLLHHHFPDRRYVEDREDVDGAHYNMTGIELARALTLRALRTDASHPWVQQYAPMYLSKQSEAYRRYRAQYPGHRPSNYHNVPGVGVVRSPSLPSLAQPPPYHGAADPG